MASNVTFKSLGCVPRETLERNSGLSRARGLRPPDSLDGAHLAVVGSGPSLLAGRRLHELRKWRGPIWGVNGTARQLQDLGIPCWFFSVDPKPVVADLALCAKRALVADVCHPSVFDALIGADTRIFDVLATPRGCTSATSAPYLAISLGASRVSFFGCEGSYSSRTHSYGAEAVPMLIEVECGGETFLTKPEFAMQTEFLADVIRSASHVFIDRSGGFLRALVEHGAYTVTKVSPAVAETVTRSEAAE